MVICTHNVKSDMVDAVWRIVMSLAVSTPCIYSAPYDEQMPQHEAENLPISLHFHVCWDLHEEVVSVSSN
jgi:hypothetical protein